MRRWFIGGLIVLFPTSFGWTQTIQLPTVRSFHVGTTVTVPDRGAALLGGNSRSDVTPNASRHMTTGGYVSARIIDLSEMDAVVLAEAGRGREGWGREGRRYGGRRERPDSSVNAALARARFLSRYVGRAPRHVGVAHAIQNTSLYSAYGNSLNQQGSGTKSHIDTETAYAELMQRGREAMKAGRYRAAKNYFIAAAAK